jgi:hypothetical protein
LAAELVEARGTRAELEGARARLTALEAMRAGRRPGLAAAARALLRHVRTWDWLGPFLAAGAVGLVLYAPIRLGWVDAAVGWLRALFGVAFVAAAAANLRTAWRESGPAREQAHKLWERPLAQRDHLDTVIAVARAEVTTVQRQLQDLTATGQLEEERKRRTTGPPGSTSRQVGPDRRASRRGQRPSPGRRSVADPARRRGS